MQEAKVKKGRIEDTRSQSRERVSAANLGRYSLAGSVAGRGVLSRKTTNCEYGGAGVFKEYYDNDI